jgi:hypothetical protein
VKSALFKEMNYPLPKLMEYIDKGVIGLPDTRVGRFGPSPGACSSPPELSASGARESTNRYTELIPAAGHQHSDLHCRRRSFLLSEAPVEGGGAGGRAILIFFFFLFILYTTNPPIYPEKLYPAPFYSLPAQPPRQSTRESSESAAAVFHPSSRHDLLEPAQFCLLLRDRSNPWRRQGADEEPPATQNGRRAA